jgi:16S rRNA (uracil1498-N3)-methyltransferase
MALQASVELGCSSVVAWQAEHSISRWDGKEQKSLERWRQIAVAAMKQSQQAFLPDTEGPLSTSDLKPTGHGILLLPEADIPLSEVDLGATEYSMVVGPEGGIAKPEIEQLTASGFVAYRLGESVMRTSTAGPAAISAIKTLRGLW